MSTVIGNLKNVNFWLLLKSLQKKDYLNNLCQTLDRDKVKIIRYDSRWHVMMLDILLARDVQVCDGAGPCLDGDGGMVGHV